MELSERASSVSSGDDLVSFLLALREDLLTNRRGWENTTIEGFLEAAAAWCADAGSENREPDQEPTWSFVATLLLAGSRYEWDRAA